MNSLSEGFESQYARVGKVADEVRLVSFLDHDLDCIDRKPNKMESVE